MNNSKKTDGKTLCVVAFLNYMLKQFDDLSQFCAYITLYHVQVYHVGIYKIDKEQPKSLYPLPCS